MAKQSGSEILGLIIGAGLVVLVALFGSTQQDDIPEFQHDRIQSLLAQYDLAKRSGSRSDMCLRAGMLSATYLELNDADEYQRWLRKQEHDCQLFGRSP